MEGFVNNSVENTFRIFRHDSNRAKTEAEKFRNNTTTTPSEISTSDEETLSPSIIKREATDIFESSINNYDKTIVDTVTDDNKNKTKKLRKGLLIGGSAIGLGGVTLAFTRGRISKLPLDTFKNVFKEIPKKIETLKQKPSISGFDSFYLSFLQKMNSFGQKVRGAIFNITPIKDSLFSKIVYEKLGLKKPCDAITRSFRKLSFDTVRRSYRKSSDQFKSMENLFEETNKKILSGEYKVNSETAKETVERLNEHLNSAKKAYKKSFGETEVKRRSDELVDKLSDLDEKVYEHVYKKRNRFIKSVDSMTTFIPEKMIEPIKTRRMISLESQRKVLTNTPKDNHRVITDLLSDIEKNINPKDKESINMLKNMKALSKEYISASGETEAISRGTTINQINSQISSAMEIIKKDTYNPEQTKILEDILQKISETVNGDKKGEIEEMLTIYKAILPPEKYAELKKVAEKATKSLKTAIKREGVEYIDKVRDLSVGSALTDVGIGMAVPVISTGIAMSAADTKQKKRSVLLRYGLPLIAGIATTTTCTLKLISGGYALILGGIVSLVGNELFERLDKKLIEQDNREKA